MWRVRVTIPGGETWLTAPLPSQKQAQDIAEWHVHWGVPGTQAEPVWVGP